MEAEVRGSFAGRTSCLQTHSRWDQVEAHREGVVTSESVTSEVFCWFNPTSVCSLFRTFSLYYLLRTFLHSSFHLHLIPSSLLLFSSLFLSSSLLSPPSHLSSSARCSPLISPFLPQMLYNMKTQFAEHLMHTGFVSSKNPKDPKSNVNSGNCPPAHIWRFSVEDSSVEASVITPVTYRHPSVEQKHFVNEHMFRLSL